MYGNQEHNKQEMCAGIKTKEHGRQATHVTFIDTIKEVQHVMSLHSNRQ